MKVTVLMVILIFFSSVHDLLAQKGKVSIALNYAESGNLEKAVEIIGEAVDSMNPKAKNSVSWPRAWEVRGEIYQVIYKSQGYNQKSLHSDPLSEAYKSYLKADELDITKRFSSSIQIKLQLLIADLSDQAEKAFKAEDYNKALESFEQILVIGNMAVYQDEPAGSDTVINYNAGLAAFNAGKYDKAVTHFSYAAENRYNGSGTYDLLASSYLCNTDTTMALTILKKGLKIYPADVVLLSKLIDLCQKQNCLNDVNEFLNQALLMKPDSEFFHFARGYIEEQMGKSDEAIQCYQKAIKLNPQYAEAYINLGLVYYNRGVSQLEMANAIPGNQTERYEIEKSKADVEFRKALPYFEKSRQLEGSNNTVLDLLKTLYYRLQMFDKHAAVLKILEDKQ